MNKRWLIIVLFISLAFNLAIMLMFSYMNIYHRPPFCPPGMRPHPGQEQDRMHQPIANQKIREMMGEDKAEMKKFRDDFAQKREAFMKTLSKDTLNVKEAEAAMDASLKAHEDLERHLGQTLIKVRQKITSKEAQTFFKERLERMNHNKDRFRHRRDSLRNEFKQNKETTHEKNTSGYNGNTGSQLCTFCPES